MEWTFEEFKTSLDGLHPAVKEKALEIAKSLVIEKNYTTDNIKNSLAYFESALSLPCYYALSNNEIDFIIDKTNLIINKN